MKKFFLFAMLFSIAALAFSQSNTQIANTINRSKELNVEVINPDLIYPGQVLTFVFADHYKWQTVVKLGDNQWNLIKNKLQKLEVIHGGLVSSNISSNVLIPSKKNKQKHNTVSDKTLPWYVWFIVGCIFLLLVFLVIMIIRNTTHSRGRAIIIFDERNETDSSGSPLYLIAGEHDFLVEEFMRSQVAHKVTMKFHNKEGWVETILETKNQPAPSPQKKPTEKK